MAHRITPRIVALASILVILLALVGCGGGGTPSAEQTSAQVDSIKKIASTSGGGASGNGAATGTSGSSLPHATEDDLPLAPPRGTPTPDTDPDPDPNEFVAVEFEAVPQNDARLRPLIMYPAAMKAKKIGGTVYVKILIDKDGYYKRHIVRDSPDPALADAVVEQIKHFYCTPARKNGKPIKVWVNFEHEFKP
jgi:TonB family protein